MLYSEAVKRNCWRRCANRVNLLREILYPFKIDERSGTRVCLTETRVSWSLCIERKRFLTCSAELEGNILRTFAAGTCCAERVSFDWSSFSQLRTDETYLRCSVGWKGSLSTSFGKDRLPRRMILAKVLFWGEKEVPKPKYCLMCFRSWWREDI